MGSKNRIAKDIVPILEKVFYDNQCELFIDACCGGCNLIDKVDKNIPRYANDLNKYLIEMFKGLQKGVKYPKEIDKSLYDLARDVFNGKNIKSEYLVNMSDDIVGWIGWMGSYNGRFFDGGYSGHNVKIKEGKFRDYITENIKNVEFQMYNLQNVVFTNKSLFDIKPKKKSLIYFDIPYKNTKQYAISKNFDYDKFYDFCKSLKKDGHVIFISEYSMPEEFNLIWEKEVKTTINHASTLKPTERLYTI